MNRNWKKFKNLRIIYPIPKTSTKCINTKTRCYLCNQIHRHFGTARWVRIGGCCYWICNKAFQHFLKQGKVSRSPLFKKIKRTLPRKFCSCCGRLVQSRFRPANQNEVVFKKFPQCLICEQCTHKPPSILDIRTMIQNNPKLLVYLTKDLEIEHEKTTKIEQKSKEKPKKKITSKKRIHYDLIEKKAEDLMTEEEDIKSMTIQYSDLSLSTIGPQKNPYQQLFSLKSQIPENVFRQVVDFHNANVSVVCTFLHFSFFFLHFWKKIKRLSFLVLAQQILDLKEFNAEKKNMKQGIHLLDLPEDHKFRLGNPFQMGKFSKVEDGAFVSFEFLKNRWIKQFESKNPKDEKFFSFPCDSTWNSRNKKFQKTVVGKFSGDGGDLDKNSKFFKEAVHFGVCFLLNTETNYHILHRLSMYIGKEKQFVNYCASILCNFKEIKETTNLKIWGQEINFLKTICADRQYLAIGCGLKTGSSVAKFCMWCNCTTEELRSRDNIIQYSQLSNWRTINQYHAMAIQPTNEEMEELKSSILSRECSRKSKAKESQEREFEREDIAREKRQLEYLTNFLPPFTEFSDSHRKKFENDGIACFPILPALVDSMFHVLPDMTVHGWMRNAEKGIGLLKSLNDSKKFESFLEEWLGVKFTPDRFSGKLKVSVQQQQLACSIFDRIVEGLEKRRKELCRYFDENLICGLHFFFENLWGSLKLMNKRMSVEEVKQCLFQIQIVGDLFFEIWKNKKMNHYLHDLTCHAPALIVYWRGNIKEFAQKTVEAAVKENRKLIHGPIKRKCGTVCQQLLKEAMFHQENPKKEENFERAPKIRKIEKTVTENNTKFELRKKIIRFPMTQSRVRKGSKYEKENENEIENENEMENEKRETQKPSSSFKSKEYPNFAELQLKYQYDDKKAAEMTQKMISIEKEIEEYLKNEQYSTKPPLSISNFANFFELVEEDNQKKKEIARKKEKKGKGFEKKVKAQYETEKEKAQDHTEKNEEATQKESSAKKKDVKKKEKKKEKNKKCEQENEKGNQEAILDIPFVVCNRLKSVTFESCDPLVLESLLQSYCLPGVKTKLINLDEFKDEKFKDNLKSAERDTNIDFYICHWRGHYSVLFSIKVSSGLHFLHLDSKKEHAQEIQKYFGLKINLVSCPRQSDENGSGYFVISIFLVLVNFIETVGPFNDADDILNFIQGFCQNINNDEISYARDVYQMKKHNNKGSENLTIDG